jgi:hypothetical protein
MKRIIFSLVGVVILVAMSLHTTAIPQTSQASQSSEGVKVQLAMILDGSGSIDSTEWAVIVNGLADAVGNPDCVPQDGSVELTVIQFSTNARLEVGPVVINPSNAGDVSDDIRNISQLSDSTCISCGICLAADTLRDSVNFDPGIKQALNLVTDGVPNRCSCVEGSCGYSGSGCSGYAAQDSAECARAYALDELEMTVDQDEFDAEGIGITSANRNWLRDYIVWPQPGYIAPPFDQGMGWVRVVEDFEEFAETICEKFQIVLYGSITAHKFNDLNGDGDQDGGEDDLEGWTMTLYEGSDCTGGPLASGTTDINGNVVFDGLGVGTYSVKETLEGGWTNSTALCQQVPIGAGESATLNFGNVESNLDIEVVKTADPTTVSEAGTVVTYTYTVTNTGDVTLTGIKVTDDKLGDITLGKTTLAPDESTSGTASYNVTQADIDAGDDIVNVADVTCEQEVTDSDSATVEIYAEADIKIVKTADPTTVSEAGTVVTYTYTVTDTGDVTLTGIKVTDDKLGDITLGKTTLAPDESTSGTASYNVTQADIDAGDDIVNVATVTCDQEFTDEATATVTITQRPPPSPARGGGGCPTFKYLTVDWEGNNTTKPLYRNGKLAVDLLGPNPDGSHSLLLERATHAPTVYGKTHYLIIIRELEEIPLLPENTIAIVVFNITPADAVFDKDIFLTLGFDQLPEHVLNATIAYYDDVNEVWVPVDSEAGGPNGVAELTLSAPINHFTIFGVLAEVAPPSPAHFVPSGLSIEPIVEKLWEHVTFVTKTGESVTITANVVNDGGQGGTYIVELKLNGEAVDTKILTLGAGQSQQVSFTVSGLGDGPYEVEVAGLNGEFTASRTITWWLIIGLIIWVIVILAVLVWGIRRKRRATQEG